MDLFIAFLTGAGQVARENTVPFVCLAALGFAVWRAMSWTANKVVLPIVKRILGLFDVAEAVFVAMGHDVGELKTSATRIETKIDALRPQPPLSGSLARA